MVTRMAEPPRPEAVVRLQDLSAQLGVIFRAMGGQPHWRLAAATEQQHQGPRRWMQRLAGGGDRAALPVLDAETLALPPELSVFDQAPLNRDLYLWLAGQGAWRLQHDGVGPGDWVSANLQATATLLQQYPGWRARYRRLVEAHLRQRPPIARLKGRAAAAEQAVQQALRHTLPWSDPAATAQGFAVPAWPAWVPPVQPEEVQPVYLWVDLLAGQAALAAERGEQGREAEGSDVHQPRDERRRRARQTTDSHERHGLMMFFRAESILSWTEFVRVNRQTDDDPDAHAAQAANDMDTLSVAPGGQTLASRVRFDLDLPSASVDDTVLAEGIRLPEWDHRRRCLLPDHCAVQVLLPRVAAPWGVSAPLRATAQRMRRRLESLRAMPRWQGGHTSGERLDMDAWVRHRAEQVAQGGVALLGQPVEPRVYARTQRSERSLATLLLADLSLSTDAWATHDARVIDVIRDALYVFGQAMDGLGDPFEILGFSSVRREHVRVHALKRFDEAWGAAARDRVGAIKPGYYTRMGAALRYATRQLGQRTEKQRLLLLLTDGKPNDLDHYEGRFGLEDTRHAVQAARAAGLHPFCITIDEKAADYLPYLFGTQGYALVHRPQDLVRRLTQVVATLSS
ncbi:MAG TPA: VWA domain-containing protein [Aquabacterium sp.]|uniref:nitric oxide reductase activation protein NorD n=1 Tax=Aquabacterium sp. TaxID=1872578 RepID=UPI002E33FDAD|nr:VWA domain-containing protein [Aquabacterium sp.]HEX5374200.1 VWA domain-containing protein [Aquabacterium sp.]